MIRPRRPRHSTLALAFLAALAGGRALAHGGAAEGGAGGYEAAAAALTLGVAALGAAGSARLVARTRAARGRHLGRAALFLAGLAVVMLALVGPMPALAGRSFAAHMVEHELLMVVAAPLIVLARPLALLIGGLPAAARGAAAALLRRARPLAVLGRPGVATALHGAALWAWHVPALFEAAVAHPLVHAAQHASFLGSALLFWWAVLPRQRAPAAGHGLAVLHLGLTSIHAGALGALFVFARRPWYPGALIDPATLDDQVLAGLVMWVVACSVYVVAAVAMCGGWIRASGAHHPRQAGP